jgi:hypothetical protein
MIEQRVETSGGGGGYNVGSRLLSVNEFMVQYRRLSAAQKRVGSSRSRSTSPVGGMVSRGPAF